MHTAMTVVMVSFLALNVSLYFVVPMAVMRQTPTPILVCSFSYAFSSGSEILTSIQELAQRGLGDHGIWIFSLIVSISALGALNANVFATATLCVAASHRGYLPPVFANLHCPNPAEETAQVKNCLGALPIFLSKPATLFSSRTARKRWSEKVPMCEASSCQFPNLADHQDMPCS